MSVRILHDRDEDRAVFYDSVQMIAFGPVLDDGEFFASAKDAAAALLDYIGTDARGMSTKELSDSFDAMLTRLKTAVR